MHEGIHVCKQCQTLQFCQEHGSAVMISRHHDHKLNVRIFFNNEIFTRVSYTLWGAYEIKTVRNNNVRLRIKLCMMYRPG